MNAIAMALGAAQRRGRDALRAGYGNGLRFVSGQRMYAWIEISCAIVVVSMCGEVWTGAKVKTGSLELARLCSCLWSYRLSSK